MTVFVRSADGTQLACDVWGQGPTVVLAHGFLLDRSIYGRVAEALLKLGRRVISFDQRNHGESHGSPARFDSRAVARDYRALLEHFDVRDGTLVGHSMGGFYSVAFAIEEPECARSRLSRMVLLGGNAGAVARGSLPNRLQIPLLASGILPPLWRVDAIGRAFARQVFGPGCNASDVEATRRMLMRQDVPRTLPMMRAMCNESYYERLGEISVDTRVLCGDRDHTCPPWHSERLGKDIPRATNTWLKGKGHMLSFEAPDAVVAAITA
jgi:pimeloyl-ACP methyl ester carboxylesterase